MATLHSLISLTSEQLCWPLFLCQPPPSFPFYNINLSWLVIFLFLWQTYSLSILCSCLLYPACSWSTGNSPSHPSIYSPWKDLTYFLVSFTISVLKMPIASPRTHLPSLSSRNNRQMGKCPWGPNTYLNSICSKSLFITSHITKSCQYHFLFLKSVLSLPFSLPQLRHSEFPIWPLVWPDTFTSIV